ncbi:MAG: hypothetical protein JNN15_21315, partial [Blastocatellia bacterium]|nr:hypothetical protein [Blastocatellia bacterium]
EIVVVEPTNYEMLNLLIDNYLKAFISGDSRQAQNRLETAKAIATLMLRDTDEKVGIDTVEYYSNVSVNVAQQLLEARQQTQEVSKVVAIDKFQDSIDKLERAKQVFVQHNAIADIQDNVFLLAKFLTTVNRIDDAKKEVETWLKVAEEKGYLFNKAKLLYQESLIASYQGTEQVAVKKSLESLEICKEIAIEKFTLYPLLLVSQIYSDFDQNDLAFADALQGIAKSLKFKHSAFSSQFFYRAGLVSFGLGMPALAETYLREAIRIAEQEGFHGYLAVAKSVLAALLAERASFAEAKQLIEEAKTQDAVKTLDLMARKQQLFRISEYEGKVYGLAKDFARAEKAYRTALKLAGEIGYSKITGLHQCKQGLGEAIHKQGRKPEALKELLEAKSMYTKARLNLQVESKNRLLDVNFSDRDIDEAIRLVQR